MGKKDKNKKKGLGIEKTATKTDKKLLLKQKKLLQKLGEDDIEKIVATLEQNQVVETTEKLIPPPSARVNASVCAVDDLIYTFGGEFFNGQKTVVYGDFIVYNTLKNEWKQITASPCPPPRSGHQMIVSAQNGGELYLFGGEFASPSSLQFYHYKDLWCYRLATKKWDKIQAPNGPSARSGHRMVLHKKKIYLFGGFHDNDQTFKYFNDVYMFSLETYQWTKLEVQGMGPTARSGGCIAAGDDKLFVWGGYTKSNDKKDAQRGTTHADFFVLAPVDKTNPNSAWKWQSTKPGGARPIPRSGVTSVTAANQRVYCFGGVMDTEEDDENLRGQFSNEIHFLDVTGSGVWRKVELTKKKKEKDSEEKMEVEAAAVTTTSDGIFTVTVGGAKPKEAATSTAVYVEITGPSPRMNAAGVVCRNHLYVYGGSYEQGARQYTLSDFYSLDLAKLDGWKTIIANMPSLQWFGSDSESGSDSDDSDESDDSDDSDESSDDEM